MKALALVVLLIACNRDKPAAKQEKPTITVKQPTAPPRPAELQRVTLKALGMYCEESCPLKVRHALADNKSIYELGFDVANESIFVSYDKSLGAPKDVTQPMLKAIKDAGYDPWLAKEAWPDDAKDRVQVVLR